MSYTVDCEYCGKEFQCSPKRYMTSKHHCCSKECAAKLRIKIATETDPDYLNCTCPICGTKFHLKPYAAEKDKAHTCSPECLETLRRNYMVGENNHQYGLKGELNASWKGGRNITSWGYIKIYMPEHPFATQQGYIFEHRYIAEQYLLNEENSVEIDGKRYLNPDYVVHHIDENRQNNNVSNLMVMTLGEHTALHNKKNIRERDELGRFKGKEK